MKQYFVWYSKNNRTVDDVFVFLLAYSQIIRTRNEIRTNSVNHCAVAIAAQGIDLILREVSRYNRGLV